MLHDGDRGMTLAELRTRGVEGQIMGSPEQLVFGVQHDSRRVAEGDLFVAVPGQQHDGARFVGDALRNGAVAVIAERAVDDEVPQLIVRDARAVLGRAAELVYGDPTTALHAVAITGTNGKTTTAHLLKQAIEGVSGTVAMIGTTGLFVGDKELPGVHTTPEGDDISRFARDALDAGATHLVLEASSHGLALGRVDALQIDVGAFTNLSRDHLDFHETLEAYGESKARLFLELGPGVAVINIDDSFGAALAGRLTGSVIRCSLHAGSGAEIIATDYSVTRDGIEATVQTPSGTFRLVSQMLGAHNLENLLVALGCADALGLDLGRVVETWRSATGSPGRLERIAHPGDVAVLVDYAHTPDALRRALEATGRITEGRLIVVFGAGGDRDRGKRSVMGEVAAELADLCVVTSDNPRSEDPAGIIAEIEKGTLDAGLPSISASELGSAEAGYCLILDRREAIELALRAANKGDTVLLAGKGHETYQIVGSERRHFDDREEARTVIASIGGSG